jgi:ABC-type Fe3+/spermidine/putrescine transport system ATPase subunit
VAVRPEKIRLLRQPAEGAYNSFPCQVEQVVYVGTDTRYQVRLSEDISLAVREQNVASAPDLVSRDSGGDEPVYAVWSNDAGRILLD